MAQPPQTTPSGTMAPAPSDEPILSIVLPNYNHGSLIKRAVAALLSQERVPDEILIIDDGSTDDSLRIIEEIAAGSSRIRVLMNGTNRGVTDTLSRGLDVSSGKYIYFAAADDWVLPGFFSTVLPIMEKYPQAGLACGDSELVAGHTGRRLGVRPLVRPSNEPAYLAPDAVLALLKRSDNWILTGSTIFVRSRVLAAGGLLSDLGSFADGYLARKVALTHGFCYVPRPMATWQVFEDSFSRETASNPVQTRSVLTKALAHFASDPVFPGWYGTLFSRRLQFGIARLAVSARPMNTAVLFQGPPRSSADNALLSIMSRLSRFRPLRAILLGWLWLRYWPMSPLLVLQTIIWRYFARASS